MMMMLMMMLMMIALYMYTLNHPLSMGMMILIQTMLTCLISGMLINTYWFSYILFLTFSGGLLVLFIYVSTIASNEMFKFSMLINSFLILLMLILLFLLMLNKFNWLNFSFIKEMNFNNNYMFYINNINKMNLMKLYNKQTFLMMMMLTNYLLITLIATIKIINISFGPLRKNFYN